MKNLLSVSVVLFNTPVDQLRSSISTILLIPDLDHLYLIDNSPTNILKSELNNNIKVTYIHNPSNPGYGAGHNIAINKSISNNCSYHLVLNSDVYFDCSIISTMLQFMEKNLHVGHLMPKVLNLDGSLQYLCKLIPSPLDLFLRRFSSSKVATSRKHHFELRQSGYDKIMFVPYLSGCFMLLRVEALRQQGCFDERFFMYPEDIDLTRRIAEKYDTIFFPFVSVTHEHGAASRKSFKMLLIHAYNIIKYFNKWGWFYDPIRNKLNNKSINQF